MTAPAPAPKTENCPVCGRLMNIQWAWWWSLVYVCSGEKKPYPHKTKVWVA